MTREQVERTLIELAVEIVGCGESEINRATTFDANGLNFDSLDNVEFLMNVEDEFDLDEITDADAQRIKTIGEAADYVWRRVSGGAVTKVE